MKAIFETTAGIIRVFNDDSEFGDPFEFSIYVLGDENIAILKGLKAQSQIPMNVFAALRTCLKEQGFTEVSWHRWKTDEIGNKIRYEVRTKI